MKHREFDSIHPYTYYVKHIPTGIKYYGVRWRNVTLGLTPHEDLGIHYFTSIRSTVFAWFKHRFQNNQDEFEYRIHYTYDTKDEAIEFEKQITRRIFKNPGWANMNSGKAINLDKKTPEERKEMARKTSIGMKGKNTGPRPEWVKQKMRDNRPDQHGEKHPRYGIKLSDQLKEKIAHSVNKFYSEHPGHGAGPQNAMYGKHRPYIAQCPLGNTFVITEGISIWCRERGIDCSSARRVALGKQKTARGWKFQFADQE